MIDPARLAYKPGWTFRVRGPNGRWLCVITDTPDSQHAGTRLTQHSFELPADGFVDDRAMARWVFDRLLECELHEAGEFFSVDEVRPFYPHHQDEGSPYDLVDRTGEIPCH